MQSFVSGILLMLLLVSVDAPASAQPEDESCTEIVTKMNAALEKYYRGRLSSYADLFAEDGIYYVNGEKIVGRETIRERLAGSDGLTDSYKVNDFSCAISGNQAVIHFGLEEGSGTIWVATEFYTRSESGWELKVSHYSARNGALLYIPKWILYGSIILAALISFVVGRISSRRKT